MTGNEHENELERQRLIRAVESDAMTLEAAEAEALRLGLGSLVAIAPADDFDPMGQPRWSLLMALAWVLVRNPVAVRNSWNAFVTTQYRWERPPHLLGSHRLVRRAPQWANEVYATRLADMAFPSSPGRSFSVSWALLRSALARGDVVGWGQDLRQGEMSDVAKIAESNWDALQLGAMHAPAPVAADPLLASVSLLGSTIHGAREDMLHFGNGVPAYTSITVERKGLLAAFPPMDGSRPLEEASNDPLQQLVDSEKRGESSGEYKRRIRLQVIRAIFPNGWPKSVTKKRLRNQLDRAVVAIDSTIEPVSEREFRRLESLAFAVNGAATD